MVLFLLIGVISKSQSQNVFISKEGSDKQLFAFLGNFPLESGEEIKDCQIGYRTFGQINEDKSNVIIYLCGYSMNSALLQTFVPNLIVDTTRYHLVLIDALANGVSTSPSNSKKQPKLQFPIITIHDMINSQYALLTKKLGIKHVVAIGGVSMGALQTLQWGVSYPDFMDKLNPYLGTPRLSSYDLLWATTYLKSIKIDPAYNRGDYNGQPILSIATHIGQMVWSTPSQITKTVSVDKFRKYYEQGEREFTFDWNNAVRQIEAVLTHDITKQYNGSLELAAKAIKAQLLMINNKQDHALNPIISGKFISMVENGKYIELDDEGGHTTKRMPFKEMKRFICE